MDRGFYSLDNVKTMLSRTFRFLIGLPLTAGFYRDAIQGASEVIHDTENYCLPIGLHVWSKVITIDAPRRGRGPNPYEVCLYLFLNPEKLMDEKLKLSRRFAEGLVSLQQNPDLYGPNNFYGKHYRIEKDEKGQVMSVEHDKEAQRRKMNE